MGDVRRVLITGVGGFVGSYLVAHLAEAYPGWQVTGTTRHADEADSVFVPCDLRDAAAVVSLIERTTPEMVIHLAGQSNVPASLKDPETTLANNILGTLHLLDACRMHAPHARLLIISSSEVYGLTPPEAQPLHEERPLRPVNPYAVSKAAQEMLALQYAHSYGLDVVVTRPFNHIGPGQTDRFVVSAFARHVVEVERGERQAVLVGNLEAARDFTDVRDVVRAYPLLLEKGERGGIYNIGRGTAVIIGDLLDMLSRLAHGAIAIECDPARLRPSDAPVMIADTTRLRQATGWQPEIPLSQSLDEILAWWRTNLTPRPPSLKGRGSEPPGDHGVRGTPR
ncbi:MAG TPA: GDP-mannose 4,6-dehydratase [Thermomicrobiales bacterium]|jgi:GDP-4-dehydro-6-deoxy-D-mannose reductase